MEICLLRSQAPIGNNTAGTCLSRAADDDVLARPDAPAKLVIIGTIIDIVISPTEFAPRTRPDWFVLAATKAATLRRGREVPVLSWRGEENRDSQIDDILS